MRDGPFFGSGMRDESKFKGGMRDSKGSAGSRKLVIFMARRGNSCLYWAGNGMVDSQLSKHHTGNTCCLHFQRPSKFVILVSKINLRPDHCLIFKKGNSRPNLRKFHINSYTTWSILAVINHTRATEAAWPSGLGHWSCNPEVPGSSLHPATSWICFTVVPSSNPRSRFVYSQLAPVVQRVDNAIHRINRYPVDKCWQNKLHYPPDSDLSGG